jgi:hypothetical protein
VGRLLSLRGIENCDDKICSLVECADFAVTVDGVYARVWYAGFRSLKHGLWDSDCMQSRLSRRGCGFLFVLTSV